MAYSKIEQAYLDGLVQAQFPDPVEPEPTLLASADTGITTDGGAYVGTRLNMPKGLNTPENMQAVGNDIPKTVAGVAKGMAQGFVGLPGDLEGIGRLVLNYMGADVNEQTKLPTTQDVKGFLDQYIKLPELQTGDMSNFETAGEWLAPGGQLKAVKPVAKAIKGAVKMTEGLPVGLSTKAVGQGVDELGFYSAAAKAVDAIQQPKGTGEQFLAQITKTPGVKQDEIMWTGLDDFLKSKKTVTKQEVQDYLANNRVDIKEVQLGGMKINDKSEYALPEVMKVINENQGDGPDGIRLALVNDYDAYQALTSKFPNLEDTDNWGDRVVEDIIGSGGGGTKFSKWQLPGGENYREVFMTLPPKPISEDEARVVLGAKPDAKLSEADLYYAARKKQDDYIVPRAHSSGVNEGDVNRIAHLRVNDRVDADGKKVLFVEEVQSDWHQAGRKQGYNTPERRAADQKKLEALDAERKNLEDEKVRLEELAKPYTDQGKDAPSEILDKWNMTANRLNNLQREYAPIANKLATGSGVPDAPFKTTWQELAMKRAIQMASEGGYDRIAFTTGKIQNQRYNLSNQINEASAIANKDGTYNLVLEDKSGNEISEFANSGKRLTPQELEDTVGKDLAKKLIDGADSVKDKPWPKSASVNPAFFSVRGVDLDIGGEGMKGFYDNILPKFLDKYAKKWDAKTGMTKIRLETDAQAVEDAQLLRELGVDSNGKSSASVHYIDITPKMRESVVTKGQPMFAIGAGGAGATTQQNQEKK